jgi:iron(II)-dependent oxidoreductase
VSNRRVLGALLLLLAACSKQDDAGTGTRLLVTFVRSVDAPELEYLKVTWVGGGQLYRRDERVPASGPLPLKAELGIFQIAVRDPGAWRIIVARGVAGGEVVAEGAVRAYAMADVATPVTLTLFPGRMPDSDGDEIPDPIDNCPDQPNREQGEDCQGPRLDGGPGPADDGGAEVGSPPDAEPPRDTLTPPPDLRPDSAPVDLGSGKTARGGACLTNDECETGYCADSRVGKFCASPGMVVVPAGAFPRGCLSKDTMCAADERPLKMVMVSGFEMNQTEVTQSEYDTCVKAGVCPAPAGFNPGARPNHPVGNVAWDAASKFCTWAGKRLPTEAEWEKAARGPASGIYPWGDDASMMNVVCSRAQLKGCGPAESVPVRFLAGASGYGIEDLAGNVAEWVSDLYNNNYYASAPSTDPPGPATGMHLRRGGGFTSDLPALRTSARAPGDAPAPSVGFRCARSL